MKYHKLVVVGKEYVFKSVTQVVERHEDSYYNKWKFSGERPWDDVRQFLDICDVVRNLLPPERACDPLRSEPAYVWIGTTDLSEAPMEGGKRIGNREEGNRNRPQ